MSIILQDNDASYAEFRALKRLSDNQLINCDAKTDKLGVASMYSLKQTLVACLKTQLLDLGLKTGLRPCSHGSHIGKTS